MSIEYKVIERANPLDRSKKKYYPSVNITGETTTEALCAEIEEISTVSSIDVAAVLRALAKVIPRHLAEGKSIHIDKIGHLRISVSATGSDKAEDVNVHAIKEAHILFEASTDLKDVTKKLKYRKIK